jgi:hypothetical protein
MPPFMATCPSAPAQTAADAAGPWNDGQGPIQPMPSVLPTPQLPSSLDESSSARWKIEYPACVIWTSFLLSWAYSVLRKEQLRRRLRALNKRARLLRWPSQ